MKTISLICFPAAIIYTIWWIWYFCLMASLYSHCLPWPTRMHGMPDQYSAGIIKKKWASGVLYENQKLWSAEVMAESYITDAIPSAMNHVLPVVEITWFLPVWIVIAVTALVYYHVCAVRVGEGLCYTYHASKSIECWRSKKGTQIFHRVPFLIHFWCLLLQNTSHCYPSCDFSRLLFIKYKGNNAYSEAVWWFLILNLSLDCFFWYVTCTAYRLSVCP